MTFGMSDKIFNIFQPQNWTHFISVPSINGQTPLLSINFKQTYIQKDMIPYILR